MTNNIVTAESVLDLSEAMANMDGDTELLQEIVGIFLETAESLLETIRQCIEIDDASQVAIQAHAMKGGASNFCAVKFVASALSLERLAKTGSLEGAGTKLDDMCADFAEVVEVAKSINWDEVERNWQG